MSRRNKRQNNSHTFTILLLLGAVYYANQELMIDHMSGVEFEHYMVGLLRKRGYKHIRMTEKYDLGIDIIGKKDGITWGIQVKRYSNTVGPNAVRQAYTALSHYGCDRAMVISNSTYSNPARILANKTHTVLIDRHQLATWMKQR